jgi:Xaa-Pro aminopeptidase
MDVAGRLGRLRELLAASGGVAPSGDGGQGGDGSRSAATSGTNGGGRPADRRPEAILVTKRENVRYLSGFSGSAGMLLVAPSVAVLFTDGRYREQAAPELAAAGVVAELEIDRLPGQIAALKRATSQLPALALEEHAVSWALQRRLADELGAELVPSGALVEQLRVVKDAGELARIEAACDIADVALAQVKEQLASRCTENELAAELEHEMRRRGASGAAFETIVASGPNGARPHARPGERVIERGDLVVIDFGATVAGYRSDMTRTLCAGAPPDQLRDVVDAVFVAQRAGVRAVKAGASGSDVDRACRESLEAAGLGELFVHGTGHGVGLEVHESPALAVGSADILQAGSVVTVEPGAYLPDLGGVRIEDTLVVTETGARALTKSTKDYTL